MVQLVLPFDPLPQNIDNNVLKRSICSNVQYFFGQSKISKYPLKYVKLPVENIIIARTFYEKNVTVYFYCANLLHLH